ncbi:hypothetical protein ACUH7Y_25395 [Clostridium beijerinckii]|uniref:Uncharacterized protein n=1 Tax=Clostridium beijerinckii TaxID=1520 RepID=A0A7X9SRS6_CLOBE|nr:hypothetical protein [Clostridium beijerinckii]NMF06568.1 hypothetical protein [Clostridium beijerinckii]
MNYKGWIMAIHDKYKIKYNEKYKNIYNKRKFKELEVKEKLVLIFYSISVIIGAILYGAGIVLNNPWMFICGTLLMIFPPMILIYFDRFEIEIYKRHARVLREVLEEENINTVSVIDRLIKDTSGALYKIKDGVISNYMKVFSSVVGTLGAAFGVGNWLDKLKGDYKNIAIFVIVMIIFIFTAYIISFVIPNSKKVKLKELHEVLKILLIYEEGKNI